MIKTLIIGGSGYLGRHLSNVLSKNNNEVYITSRFVSENDKCFVFDLEDINCFRNIAHITCLNINIFMSKKNTWI